MKCSICREEVTEHTHVCPSEWVVNVDGWSTSVRAYRPEAAAELALEAHDHDRKLAREEATTPVTVTASNGTQYAFTVRSWLEAHYQAEP